MASTNWPKTMDHNHGLELAETLKGLQHKKCWCAVGGPGTGSMIHLHFGDKIPRSKPLSNPHLTPEVQNFEGEIGLFIQFAAWRIDTKSSVICSSTTSNELDGPFGAGLQLILDKPVVKAEVSFPGLDIRIEFAGGVFLTVFCDQTNIVDENCNYSVRLKNKGFSIDTNSRVVRW